MDACPIRLESDRLVVRRFEERDVPDILAYSRDGVPDPFRRHNLGWQLTEESIQQWWAPMRVLQPEEALHWLSLVIELKNIARVIGNVGFNARRFGNQFQGMIGWTLGSAYEGHGYATEAARILLAYLFDHIGFHRVYALTSPGNQKSWRVMERLGMRQEAHFRKNRFDRGAWEDEVVYAILAEEWAAQHSSRCEHHAGKLYLT